MARANGARFARIPLECLFCHVMLLAHEKTKVVTSQKSFGCLVLQTLFLAKRNVSGKYICVRRLKVVIRGLKSLCSNVSNKHIRIQSDNTTTVAYLNAMVRIKSHVCNDVAFQSWDWCSQRHVWLSASHIPGSNNVEADRESRNTYDSTEWSLSTRVYNNICQVLGPFPDRLLCLKA